MYQLLQSKYFEMHLTPFDSAPREMVLPYVGYVGMSSLK